MRPRLKHFRHPLHTANVARSLVSERWHTWEFAYRGTRHFSNDARYDLKSVTEGFAERIDDRNSDRTLLERICTAYAKAAEAQAFAPKTYTATDWWEVRRELSLKPVIEALRTRDIDALQKMYGTFYRDPCAAGLLLAQTALTNYFGATSKNFHRRLYLIDALYRLDYWRERTGGRCTLADLSGPAIGNPFGVVIDGTLVRVGAEFQHFCAHRIGELLSSKRAMVAEIGGGFGGMAYYLLRGRPGTTYIAFDVPESIALTSYFLLKAFPSLRCVLYGEGELTAEICSQSDLVLMPAFELAKMSAASVDVTFSSHAMSDLSREAIVDYLNNIAHMTRDYFLCIGNGASAKVMAEVVDTQCRSMKVEETRSSGWHDHRGRDVNEVECLYRICGA